MLVAPVTLRGRAVCVEPLEARHAADLARATEPDLFHYFQDRPRAADPAALAEYIARQLVPMDRIAFAIVELAGSRAIGSTSYMNIRPRHRGLEIGHTWIAREAQGTQVNPETKFLLLQHAFERLRCVRVELKCDARNEQSRRAMLKLGCTYEGVLRKHMILPDGFVRDTLMFSIVDTQWPAVRDGLIARLGYTP